MYITFKNKGPNPAALTPQKATDANTQDGLFLLKRSVNRIQSTNLHAALYDNYRKIMSKSAKTSACTQVTHTKQRSYQCQCVFRLHIMSNGLL